MAASKYRVLSGIDYPDGQGGEKRVEAGGTIDSSELDDKALKALVAQGALEPASRPKAKEGGD